MIKFEEYISNYFNSLKPSKITEAMIYAMEGGKRFRPSILFAILKGMGIDVEVGYDAGLALEMIQTYSLIHDDLPAMDNDDFRRGKPSLHKAFKEDIAILTGDELLTDSFKVIADSKYYDSDTKVKLISTLANYAGLNGMIYGQLLDVSNDSASIDEDLLFTIQDNKTGGLFKIACLFAMHIAKIDKKVYFENLGSRIGTLFQNQDDLFDLIKSQVDTGKMNSDLRNNKGTALSIYSVDELKQIIDDEFTQLDNYLINANFDTKYLKEILNKLRNR